MGMLDRMRERMADLEEQERQKQKKEQAESANVTARNQTTARFQGAVGRPAALPRYHGACLWD